MIVNKNGCAVIAGRGCNIDDSLSNTSDVDAELSDGSDLLDDPELTEELLDALPDEDGDPDWLPVQEVRKKVSATARKERGICFS